MSFIDNGAVKFELQCEIIEVKSVINIAISATVIQSNIVILKMSL